MVASRFEPTNVTWCTPCACILVILYAEKQMADLIDHLRVAAGLGAREALERRQHQIRGILKVEGCRHSSKAFGRLAPGLAVPAPGSPAAAAFASHHNAEGRCNTCG